MVLLCICAPPLRAQEPANAPNTKPPATQPASIPQAIDRGVKFLVKSQNADGSWGTGTETRGTEIMSMVPGSHDAFRLGTTALCVMALRETGQTEAHDKAVQYLLK
ncbi:MAG TPA: hypothetical protein VG269_21625, partial [Tepidisphaeraceae bacterium]|nr:hypothetical protein [Tepidisphaeraceae bacterium]